MTKYAIVGRKKMSEQEYLELVELILTAKKFDVKTHTDKSIKRISNAYATEYKSLFNFVMNELIVNFGVGATPSQADVYALLAQIETRLTALDNVTMEAVKKELETTYLASTINYKKVVEEINNVDEMLLAVPFSMLNTYRVERLISETSEDLLFATKHVNKECKKAIQEVFNKHIQLQAFKDTAYKDVMRAIEKELTATSFKELLTKRGFSGLIDSRGRRWNLSTYTKLVVTSKMSEAYHEALQEEAMEEDFDLAIISENGATDHCRHFEGMVISLNGRTKGYLTYQQLKATGRIFHPHCRHTCYPVGSFDNLHEDVQSRHYKKLKEAKKFLKGQ